MDLVITNGTVVTMDGERRVWPKADVVIRDGRVVAIGPKAKKQGIRRVIDAAGCAVLPGLIHAHVHACQTLCRNHADGLELLDWLRERIWPFEAAHTASTMRTSADLTFAELVRSGATACLDMGSVRHYDSVFESAQAAGLRVVGGKCMMDAGQGVPAGLRETTAASLNDSLRLLERWHGQANGRLRYAFAPRFVLSCSEGLLREVGRLAKERGVHIHTHASENPTECDLVRQKTGLDNVAYFDSLGLLGPHTTLAHCVWLTAAEQRLMAERGASMCHCPSSNLKLASGYAKVPELMAAGINVALGADGAPCNNNLDIFVELRLAALLHLPRVGPTGLPAMKVLEMATRNGAQALGLESDIGSLEVGKAGDVTVVDLSGLHMAPLSDDVVASLVYSAQSRDVRDVVVDGEVLLRNRRLLRIDMESLASRARTDSARLLTAM